MKGLQTFLLSLLVSVSMLCACGRHEPCLAVLTECDSMVTVRPHEVIDRLDALDSTVLKTRGDSAMYELLYREAMRRLGITFTRDTFIQRSAYYFEALGDDNHYARTLLQWGLALYDARRYVASARKLKEAEAIAGRLHSPELDYRIAAALGEVNRVTGCSDLMLEDVRKALASARQSGSADNEGVALNAMALAWRQTENSDSFALAVRRIQEILPRVSREQSAPLVSTVALGLLEQGDTVKAERLLTDNCDKDPDRRASLYLGDVYAAKHQKLQAVSCWYDAADSFDHDIHRTALQRLAEAAAVRSDLTSALYLSQQLNDVYARAVTAEETAQVADVQVRFDQEAAQQQTRHTWVVGVLVGVLVLGVLLVLWGYDRRKVRRLRRDIAKYQNDQAKPVQWDKADTLLSAPEVQHLHEAAAKGQMADRALWNDVHRFLGAHDPHLSALLADHPTLAWSEVNLIMLIRLRFAPSEMATLTGFSSQNVTNLRVRLLRKMFGEKGGARDFDARIRLL